MKNISDDVNEKYSKALLRTPYKMFLTIIEPSYFERLYSETIYGPQSRLLMLALNIVNKSPNYFQLKAKKIFSKMTSIIFKKYHNEIKIGKHFLTLKGKDNQNKSVQSISILSLDKQVLQNHPVHIVNKQKEFSQSSFIPFCAFGDKLIGSIIDEFDMKVCNIFKPKLHYDQLCFETDLQELRDKDNFMNQLELGLTLVLDYNEERQINQLSFKNGSISKNEFSFNLNNSNSLSMFLEKISIHTF